MYKVWCWYAIMGYFAFKKNLPITAVPHHKDVSEDWLIVPQTHPPQLAVLNASVTIQYLTSMDYNTASQPMTFVSVLQWTQPKAFWPTQDIQDSSKKISEGLVRRHGAGLRKIAGLATLAIVVTYILLLLVLVLYYPVLYFTLYLLRISSCTSIALSPPCTVLSARCCFKEDSS